MNRALAMQPDDEMIPGRDDLDDVNLATFKLPDDPRADGFVEPGESELQAARDGIAALRWKHVTESTRQRNRDATPCPIPYPNREGESL